jgi:hypothetical protein
MSVIQPFQFLKFSKYISNQQRYKTGCGYDLCNVPVIPQGKFLPFAIVSPSNVVGDVLLTCHDETEQTINYYNAMAWGVYTKNDCPVGYVGTPVTYTVPAGKYVSIISQADANAMALAERDANGQAYANLHGSCVSEATYSLIVNEQFDNWSGGMPVGWVFNELDYTSVTNNSDRLDMTISNYPPIINRPESMNYPNIERDTGIDFGAYSQLRITIKVDSGTGDHQFVFRYNNTVSYVRMLNIGINQFNLLKNYGYRDGYSIIGITNYLQSQPYPKNVVIDYITIEGLS